MNCVRWLLHRRRRRQREQQRGHSPLLNLPADAILCIADHLPLHAKHFLAQSCSPLRAILQHHFDLSRQHLAQDTAELCSFLALLQMNMTSTHLCEWCDRLHGFGGSDVPTGWEWLFSMRNCTSPSLARLSSWRIIMTGNGQPGYALARRHTQVALKLSRLRLSGVYNGGYMDRLLAPVNGIMTYYSLRVGGEKVGYYSVAPRVSYQGPRPTLGRYLLRIEYRWDSRAGPPLRGLMAEICSHNCTSSAAWLVWPRNVVRVLQYGCLNTINQTVNLAVALPGELEVVASPSRYATDYSVQATDTRVVIRIWHDLGLELKPPFALDRYLA